jgi:hypothetical protein
MQPRRKVRKNLQSEINGRSFWHKVDFGKCGRGLSATPFPGGGRGVGAARPRWYLEKNGNVEVITKLLLIGLFLVPGNNFTIKLAVRTL